MASSQLASLVFELKLEIVRHINDATDLKNLALVSEEFRQAVAPKQFCRLDIFLIEMEDFDTHLASAFTGSNIHHTRHLHVKTRGEVKRSFAKLTALLPTNTLHRFELAFNSKIPLKPFLQICRNQSNLHTIVVPTFSNFAVEYLNDHIIMWSGRGAEKLQEIKIRGELATWKETCAVAQVLIEAAGPKLKRLKIMPFRNWRDVHASGVTGAATEIGPIPKTLFKHMINIPAACRPLKLSHLTLDNVPLDCSNMFMSQIIEFQSLSELRIRRCSKATEFLAALTESTAKSGENSMALEVFEFAEYENKNIKAVEHFLHSFKGLEQLYLIFNHTVTRPNPHCIIQHADTLSLLVVETDTTNEDDDFENQCFNLEDFKKILYSCSKLRQLSIEIPAQVIEDHSNIDWPVTVEVETAYLDHVLSLQHLRVLNVYYRNKYYDDYLAKLAWIHFADRVADSAFKQADFLNSKLVVFSIGSCSEEKFDPGCNGDKIYRRLFYVSANMKDSLGGRRVCANPVKMRNLEDAGVQMDILKYRSPWW